ncbi:putative ankyrin repeat protein [Corynascus similis CBS 632.67]
MAEDLAAADTRPLSKTSENLEEPEAATDAASTTPGTASDKSKDSDAVSVQTKTTDIFSSSEEDLPSSNQHELGLDINFPRGWDGSSYNDYDVITVHGIRDDYKTAWTDESGAWWVEKELFKHMSIREIDYSYEVDGTSLIYEPNGILQHAQQLITEYAAVRQKLDDLETDRPIIWLCHDLGGTIVKEALYLATHNPSKYGKIAILTTAIIFLETPHRFRSTYDLEDQLCRLLLLPGPKITNGLPAKVKELGRQVTRANQRFLSTKIIDRAVIFNVFVQNPRKTSKRDSIDKSTAEVIWGPKNEDNDASDPATPFPRYAHELGHSFETAGRFVIVDLNHKSLIKGGNWVQWLAEQFNSPGCPLNVNYRIIQYQAWFLALAPPTRTLDAPYDRDSANPPPVVTWIYEQDPFTNFSKPGGGPRLLHIHANGNPLLDISRVSRLLYLDYDVSCVYSERSRHRAEKTVLYFEFDQYDSRYNTISSLLLYLVNALVCHFPEFASYIFFRELPNLTDAHAWSLEDLMYFCFDQCPAEQRQWFLERVLEEQSHKDNEYRIILSTAAQDDLVVTSFPDEARINLENSIPTLNETQESVTEELRSCLSDLIAKRPIYENFRRQLESLLSQCNNAQHLGRIILTWLGVHHRGKPKSEIADQIRRLSPPTAENVARVFVAALPSCLRSRAETVFNWVKHAAEPWSPGSLAEALAIYESKFGEPSFEDLDVDATIREVEEAFGGIITVKDGDVKFSHASFYTAPEVGSEEKGIEAAAKVNGTIAETCLRYLHLDWAQKELGQLSQKTLTHESAPWATSLDAVIVSPTRTGMAEYAVRFWHEHYKASGKFKPTELVDKLFANKDTRASWETHFWLLSNPLTRMPRSYFSTLPVLAMLGLEDLVHARIESEKGRPTFHKDCWFAITEAARTGRKGMVQELLTHVAANEGEEELGTALHWAAGRGDADIVDMLLKKIPNLQNFGWPKNMMHRAAASGLNNLLTSMSQSGCDINAKLTLDELLYGPSAIFVAVERERVSTVELLLSLNPGPDLSLIVPPGWSLIQRASTTGHPRIVELLVQAGVSVIAWNDHLDGPVLLAAARCNHRVVEVLIKAGADFKSSNEHVFPPKTPLFVAAESGSQECVRVLLAHGADPCVEQEGKTALYQAVVANHLGVTRQLLNHDPKPDMDKAPPNEEKLLMRAVRTGNTELVSLLIDHGAEVDFVDPNTPHLSKTPLSQACDLGDLEMVKILLGKGAGINYTGDASDHPLLSACYAGRFEVARYLLQDQAVDVKWTASDGLNALHTVVDEPDLTSELLKRGAPINCHSTSNGTALHAAVRQHALESLKILLSWNDPKPEVDHVYGENGIFQDEIGFTPLHLACKHSCLDCLKLLLEAGANPRLKNKNGDDAVDILIQAGSVNAVQCLRLLHSTPYNVSLDGVNEQGRTRVHDIMGSTPISTVELLIKHNAPVDLPDKEGHTPLSVAVSNDNEDVARYLVKEGADVNRCSPSFGSILHIAVNRGNLNIAKFLVSSGADPDAVDPEYGESLLYTALGIADDTKLVAMVRYLVDEVKVPIDKHGGARFGYPIICAANLARSNPYIGTRILRLLIRRKARLDVADGQGRRAVHIASTIYKPYALQALVDAGAEINVRDSLGRKPIHFAASSSDGTCFQFLMDTFKNIDINEPDDDNWTPLMWAARSGDFSVLEQLLEQKADIWARGYGSEEKQEWSALKLLRFSHRPFQFHSLKLQPEKSTRVNSDGETEEWDDAFHEVEQGADKNVSCDSCLVNIYGVQWRCFTCDDGFSLCFKCFRHRSTIHDAKHEFQDIGPEYQGRTPPESWAGSHISDENDSQESSKSQARSNSQGSEDGDDGGHNATPYRGRDLTELEESNSDMEGSDEDE